MFKVSLGLIVFSISFLCPQPGFASTKVTDVIVKRSASGVSVDLLFDRVVAARALKPAFERNFVQLALRGTKIDVARMIPVTDSEVQKVFAYPYNPDTARLRIILKHAGLWGKGRLSLWNNNPKSVRLFIKDPETAADAGKNNDSANNRESRAAQQVSAPSNSVASRANPPTSAAASALAMDGTLEEKTILKEVVANTRDIDINNPDSVKAALRTTDKTSDSRAVSAVEKSEEKGPVGISADPTRHFARMAIALFGVLALFIGGVVVLKRYAGKLKTLPFGKKERLIQVVATHYLGNKNSISLVKITNEYMVVGVSNDGISLISKLGPEVNVESYIEDRFWGGTFEKHLDKFAKDPAATKEIDLSTYEQPTPQGALRSHDQASPQGALRSHDQASPQGALRSYDQASPQGALRSYDGARDLAVPVIEDRVELSPLRASIKEKLTKLKPLA